MMRATDSDGVWWRKYRAEAQRRSFDWTIGRSAAVKASLAYWGANPEATMPELRAVVRGVALVALVLPPT